MQHPETTRIAPSPWSAWSPWFEVEQQPEAMKPLAYVLAGLVFALQYPLWVGKGSWMRVWELDRQLALQREANARAKARNDALDAEVRDLKEGSDALEERARMELGMVKRDEVFYQIVPVKR